MQMYMNQDSSTWTPDEGIIAGGYRINIFDLISEMQAIYMYSVPLHLHNSMTMLHQKIDLHIPVPYTHGYIPPPPPNRSIQWRGGGEYLQMFTAHSKNPLCGNRNWKGGGRIYMQGGGEYTCKSMVLICWFQQRMTQLSHLFLWSVIDKFMLLPNLFTSTSHDLYQLTWSWYHVAS